MTATEIILSVYDCLISKRRGGVIPIALRPKSVVGTVQDDPFDCWVGDELKRDSFPKSFNIYHSGALTTPDITIRDSVSGLIVGLEIKKLIMGRNGRDPRGLTMDYNSSLPCGRAFVKIGDETVVVPCFYLFALLDADSRNIATLILLDGDFLNYDLDLYKEAKYSNFSEYGHGPYGEGSVRHRKMYTYPNPLNSQIKDFYGQFLLVMKKADALSCALAAYVHKQIIRTDKQGNSFYYYAVDKTSPRRNENETIKTVRDIFYGCKVRTSKERTAYMPTIPTVEEKKC